MASELVLGEPAPNEHRSATPVVAIPMTRVNQATPIPVHWRLVQPKVAIIGFALCAALVLSGCSSGSPTVAGPTTTTTLTPTTAPNGPTEMALSAYRAMWADMVIASRTSDYKSPLLPQHASGAALSVLIRGLAKNQLAGVVTRGTPSFQPQITSLPQSSTPMQATITDCINDTHWLDYKTDGELLNKIPGGRHSATAVVLDTESGWKVTQLTVRAVGTC
jgi:hypothetical protein